MLSHKDFLIEVGTEELPPLALPKLSAAFADELKVELEKFRLQGFEITQYAAPRRLALWVKNLATAQADQSVEKRGPAVANAFDADGNPSKAAEGFARSNKVSVDQLERMQTDQGEYLVYRFSEKGQMTVNHLLPMVEAALSRLPIPKRMRWGSGDAEFVRPVHWILALFDGKPVAGEVMGLPASDLSYGHRFHAPAAIKISSAAEYATVLEQQAYVVADFEQRKNTIRAQIEALATELNGKVDFAADAELLDEVTALNEWPVALYGNFDEEFLSVPSEALVSSMKGHQKYFPVFSHDGQLTQNFITVSNIDSKDMAQVRDGNERVIRPRLADAKFFWEQDKKQSLETFNQRLQSLVYQKKLGTVADKVERVRQLALALADSIGANAQDVQRAAQLAKADLNTEMVGEFPKLQGTMGKYYALASEENETVAVAIEDHYKPRFSGDALPESAESQALALADRFDTLVGIFAAGEKPSGTKDPYGLRRAAIAILRIIIDKALPLDIEQCLQKAAATMPADLNAQEKVNDVFDYIMARLRAEYEQGDDQNTGFTPQQINAVLSTRPTKPLDFEQRLKAVAAFSQRPEADSLAAANKRIGNLLKKVDVDIQQSVDSKLFTEDSEVQLYQELEQILPQVDKHSAAADYQAVLSTLASLHEKVDAYFDNVMVMADDQAVRFNRLALLQQLRAAFLQVADISQLQN